MELVSAAFVVKLIAGYAATLGGAAATAASGALEGFAKDGIGRLVAAVRRRFEGDPAAEDALERLDKAPDDTRRQGAVEERLEEVMSSDEAFATMLTELVEGARTSVSGTVTVTDAGATAIGGSVSISAQGNAAGRDIVTERGPS